MDTSTPWPWLVAALLAVGGFCCFRATWPMSRRVAARAGRGAAAACARWPADDGRRLRQSERSDGRPAASRSASRRAQELRRDRDHPRRDASTCAEGERHAIIGPNGAGKSTLFNLISGRFAPTSGSIALDGEDIARQRPSHINRRGLARSFQVTNIFPRLTVFENVRCSVLWSLGYRYDFWRSVERAARRERAHRRRCSSRSASPRGATSPAGVLTYAEQRALEIGITIAGGATVILLDEPTAGMSRAETENAVELIRSVSQGRTLRHGRARHERGLRSRRPHLGAGVRRDHRDRRARARSARTPRCRRAYLGTPAHA